MNDIIEEEAAESGRAAPAIDSASVVLVRAREENPQAEVLLLRRQAGSSAFAGAFVFPGGHVDGSDTERGALEAVAGFTPEQSRKITGGQGNSAQALAFVVTAIRELFEEAGVLLAQRSDGAPLDFAHPEIAARLARWRAELAKGARPFQEFARKERLKLSGGALFYFSRWITPVTAPSRFDTRFFVALMPPGQEAMEDHRETTQARWMTPGAALEEAAQAGMLLFPPTARILEELAELGSPASIIEAAQSRPVEPILPKVVTLAGSPIILLPGDTAYDAARPGQEIAPGGHPLRRMAAHGGGWRTLA